MVIRTAAGMSMLLLCAAAGSAQTIPPYKVAWYNIQGGKGEASLPGHTAPFVENDNCTEPTQPLNAWGTGVVQAELRARVAEDPDVIALGLGESWNCASPDEVLGVLGWPARTAVHNGLTLLARYGFSGPEQWRQLETSLNTTPTDTKWVVRAPVCADATCSRSVIVYATHWLATGPLAPWTNVFQLLGTLQFTTADASQPHLVIGDLNVFEASSWVCNQPPANYILPVFGALGYHDLWRDVHGSAEGYTGMANRPGCGVPEGYAWKRIDYAWLKNLFPRGITRFGLTPPGDGSPSDHYGIVAAFSAEPADWTSDPREIVMRVSSASTLAGGWRVEADTTAAAGRRLRHPDAGAAKIAVPLAMPANYVEMTFAAEAGRDYRLWIRGRADMDSYDNDSVFVQFDQAVTPTGAPWFRIGTASATTVILEDCSGCGVEGWGWQDNGYGAGVMGPLIRFASSGRQTIRIQTREDGLAIDQIVLSSARYLTTAPGTVKDDATILP
jgi:hypothetical protein